MFNRKTPAKPASLRRVSSPSSPPGRAGFAPLVLAVLAGLLVPGTLQAQGLRSLSFAAENDGLAFWTPPHQRTDWYYTHGMEIEGTLAWASPASRFLGSDVPPACGASENGGACSLTRFSVGQAIFTPEALFTTLPPVADRPYAGWLYFEASAIRMDESHVRRLGVDVGVTGGPSLAGPLHRWFHRSLGKHEAMGWDTQIPFELAFSVSFESREVFTLGESSGGLALRVEPRGLVRAGTLKTGALGGLSFQVGWKAPDLVQWAGVRPSQPYIHLALGADGELVLRDLFLDGSTFGESSHVERIPLVGHLRASVQVGTEAFAIEFSGSRRTSQFTGQGGHHSTGLIRFIVRP